MAATTGKTVALILLVAFIVLVGWRMTPLILAPFGMFTGMVHTVERGVGNVQIWPFGFHFPSLRLVSFALFILWIVVIVWVYRDAERRGMNGVLWALLVLIGNLIGLLIYLIVRSDTVLTPECCAPTQTCPKCQESIDAKFTFCPHCGKRLEEVCPKCEKPVDESWKVCPHCSEKLVK